MKNKWLKKGVVLMLATTMFALTGCAGETGETVKTNIVDSSTLKVDRDKFYGACYCAYEAEAWHGRDPLKELDAMKELGATTFRLWMSSNYVMTDSQTFDEGDVAIMKKIIAHAQELGIEVIGMNNAWFSGSGDNMAVPMRSMKEGSNYEKFLLNYEETWYQMAKKFPEITTWEIGNEWNNDVFLHPYDYESNGLIFTFTEKAEITTDMLYYASKGIHRANPEALTVLGGLVDIYEEGFGNAKNFLDKLYTNIESGEWPSTNPDDYFQIAAWHPYNHSGIPTEAWVQHNKDIYQVILDHEGHDKVVLFTEFGYSDNGNLEMDKAQEDWVKTVLEMIEKEFPFVQSVHWFRMFDEKSASSWGGEFETGFVKPIEGESGGAVCFNPDMTITGRTPTSPAYPTNTQWMEWDVTENKTTNFGWAVTQPKNPSVNDTSGEVDSLYSWYSYNTLKCSFEKMEYQVADPNYYQDSTGAAVIKGWELLATDTKYAAVVVTATDEGAMQLTSNTTLTTQSADGKFMIIQKSGDVYSILLDWQTIPQGSSVTVPNVKTHVHAGDEVYYIYRSTSATQVLFDQASLPNAIYGVGSKSTTDSYPTTWITSIELAKILGDFENVLTGMTVSLDSKIAVNVYIDTATELADDAYVEFKVPGEEIQRVVVSEAQVGTYGKKFPCHVPAKRMQDQVITSVYSGGKLVDLKVISIRQYADAVMKQDVNTISLMKAMLTYGAYAQKAFGYDVSNLANAGYEDVDEVSTVNVTDLAGYKAGIQTTSGLGSFVGMNLVLEGETTLGMYFDIESGVTPTFTYEGTVLDYVQTADGYYMVKVTGIDARELNQDYTVVVTGDGKTLNATGSALSYCYAALNSELSEEWKDLVKALYLYNVYTAAYFGEYIDSSRLVVNRDLYYGICYLAYQDQQWYGGDASYGIEAMSNLGASTTRLWMNATDIMDNTNTFNWKLDIMKDIVSETQSKGMEVIGMENHWFNADGTVCTTGNVPDRDLTSGSDYMKFLENYETMWYSLAKEFPEITKWEIGNELNQAGNLHPMNYFEDTTNNVFTDEEKAQIIADMLYHASQGIHKANPRALTVMGGLLEIHGANYNDIGNVLTDIYEAIEANTWGTTNPDDFFQIAAWHPYEHDGAIDADWVARQKELYKIITDHEGHDKVVLFTELGFSNYYSYGTVAETVHDPDRSDDVKKAYQITETELPFVQSICYFRLFNTDATTNGLFEANFGLLTKPTYIKDGDTVIGYDYYIKNSGLAFQELTGSSYEFPEETE